MILFELAVRESAAPNRSVSRSVASGSKRLPPPGVRGVTRLLFSLHLPGRHLSRKPDAYSSEIPFFLDVSPARQILSFTWI